jgi:hypothetical protein
VLHEVMAMTPQTASSVKKRRAGALGTGMSVCLFERVMITRERRQLQRAGRFMQTAGAPRTCRAALWPPLSRDFLG